MKTTYFIQRTKNNTQNPIVAALGMRLFYLERLHAEFQLLLLGKMATEPEESIRRRLIKVRKMAGRQGLTELGTEFQAIEGGASEHCTIGDFQQGRAAHIEKIFWFFTGLVAEMSAVRDELTEMTSS